MGHKGSQRHSDEAAISTLPAAIDAENMSAVLAETEELDLRGKMRKHTDVAVDALKDVAEAGESDAAKVSAAKAILDYGHGKPAQQHIHKGATTGGLVINIYRLSDGSKTEHTFDTIAQDVEDAQEVADVVQGDVARRLLEGGE